MRVHYFIHRLLRKEELQPLPVPFENIMSLSRFGRFGEVLLFSTCTQSQNCTYMLFWLKIRGLTSPV